jgi:hypothetical protein
MTTTSQSSGANGLAADARAISSRPTSASDKWSLRADTALLASALFLQRFIMPFPGGKSVTLSILPIAVIFSYQFAANRLLIQYDRLWWFLLLALSATTSLLFTLSWSSQNSYSLFLVGYFFFMLICPSSQAQYKRTLHSFQCLVFIIACLAILQFPAQLVVNPRNLIMFFGIFPDALLPYHTHVNTQLVSDTGRLVKSNGIFLGEAGNLSQIAAVAILIEVIEFRRPWYLIVLSMGFLVAYSGTGVSILLVSLPVAFLVTPRAQLPVLLVCVFAAGLFATDTIHLSAFTDRLGEFQDTGASGFARFVSPFWMAGDYFSTASLSGLLFGNGFGNIFVPHGHYTGSGSTWFKLVYEYGLIGAFVFACFLGCCFRRSWCPAPVVLGIVYGYLFTGNDLLDPSMLTIMVVLCTLRPRPAFQVLPLGKRQPGFGGARSQKIRSNREPVMGFRSAPIIAARWTASSRHDSPMDPEAVSERGPD